MLGGGGGVREGGWLGRVRNCEVRFDVETEWEMRQLPSRLSLLMESLALERMLHFRVVIQFVRTSFSTHAFNLGTRVLQTRPRVEQKAVGEGTWKALLEDMEKLDLRRFGKGEGKGNGRGHEVFVWRTWEVAEKGLRRFEELAGVIGAELKTSG